MKVALFGTTPYPTPEGRPELWPVPSESFDPSLGEQTLENTLRLVECADELGFDWVTCAEHHYSPFSISPSPMVLAGAFSQRVKRAKIAVLGPTIPILNPVKTAEEFAVVDNLTHGRLIAGFMRGAPYEYNTYSVNPAESRDRFEEALELIVQAWTAPQPFGWEGRYYRFSTVSLWPRSVQEPHPPIFMSGSSRESGRLAARHRVSIGMAASTVSMAASAAKNYREEAARAGWEPTPDNILFRSHGCVAETDAEAYEVAQCFIDRTPHATQGAAQAIVDSGYFGQDIATQSTRSARPLSVDKRIEDGYLFCGSPETVFRQLCRMRDEIGAGILELSFQTNRLPPALALRSLRLFGEEVLPRLQAL